LVKPEINPSKAGTRKRGEEEMHPLDVELGGRREERKNVKKSSRGRFIDMIDELGPLEQSLPRPIASS